jgi:hypothetical protein
MLNTWPTSCYVLSYQIIRLLNQCALIQFPIFATIPKDLRYGIRDKFLGLNTLLGKSDYLIYCCA